MNRSLKKVLALTAILGTIAFYSLQTVFATAGYAPGDRVGQTVPTRTPPASATPVPPPPTATPKKDNGGGQSQPPPPTPTATATQQPVNIAPTPINGFVQADRCGDPFFVATLGGINVRAEPSVEGEIVAKMVYLEARQVLARSADTTWWLVLLPDTTEGWVFDGAGRMVGIMESVPVINADGSRNAEPVWRPTPDLFCPTLTPSPTPTSLPTETPTAVPTETNTPEPEPTATLTPVPEDDPITGDDGSTPETEAVVDPNVISPLPDTGEESQRKPRPSVKTEQIELNPEAGEAIEAEQTAAGIGINWPIMLGIALITFGFVALMFQRRQNSSA